MPKFIGWVPTQPEFIDTFFELCPVSSSDIVYDLGSGDGRLLFTALEKGAGRCVGIDIDPERVNASREAALSKGVDDRAIFVESDVMEADLSEASVVLCYLYPTASAALRSKFEKELKPGTRVVMESFPVPGWKPVIQSEKNGRNFYFYMMPPERTPDYDTAIETSTYGYYDDYYYSYG
jgi:SAM-dependent methyltransferase